MATNPLDLYEPDVLPTGTVRDAVPAEPHTSGLKAFARSAALATVPTVGGLQAVPAGSAAGAGLGALAGGGTPAEGITIPVGTVLGGGAAALGMGWLIDKAQTHMIHALPTSMQENLGIDEATLARERSQHPVASFLGGNVPALLAFRPSWGGWKAAFAGGAINSGIQTGQDLATGGGFDPVHSATAFAIGATFGHLNPIGEALQRPANWMVERIPTGAGRTQAEQGAADALNQGLADHGLPAEPEPAQAAANLRAAAGDRLTPDEQAAIHVARDADVTRGTSPFQPGPAGDQEHGLRLGATLQAIIDGTPLPPIGAESAAHAAPAQVSDVGQVKAAIGAHESGNRYAPPPNPNSSASGKYQFTDASWRGFAREVYASKSDADLMAMKADPAAQENVMDHALASYGRQLRAAGAPETPGNLYLLHFLGPRGLDVLRADASTPIEALLPEKAIAANRPWLQGKTAGELVRDMAARTGGDVRGPVSPTVPQGAAADAGIGPSAVLSMQSEGPAGLSIVREGEDLATAIWRDDTGKPRGVVQVPISPAARELYDGVSSFVEPQFRRRGIASQLYDALAREGVPIDEVSGAHDLTPDGAAFINARRGFRPDEPMSEPLPAAKEIATRGPRARKGPIDVATFLADRGGIADTEGHDLVQGRNLQQKVPGAGNLIKPSGMSVDAAGEALWDRGYFGPPDTTPRPTEAEVLDLLERTKSGKIYHPEDQMRMADEAAANPPPPEHDEARAFIAGKADEMGLHFDNADLDQAAAHVIDGVPWDTAIERVIADRFHDANLDAAGETGQPPYEGDGHALSGNEEFGWPSEDDLRDAGRFDPSGPDAGDAGEGGHGLDEPAGVARLAGDARGDAARLEHFSDPAGEGQRAATESIVHDLQMDGEDGEARTFRLDVEGGETSADDALAAIAADKKAWAELEACLPVKGAVE